MSGQALDRCINAQSMALTSAGIRQHHRSTVDSNCHAMISMWHKQALDSLMRLNKGFYLSTIGFCSATSKRHWISNQFAAPWKPHLHAGTPYYTSMFEQTFGYVFVCIYTYKHMYICTHLIDVYIHTCSNHYTWDWAIHIKPYISNPSMVIKMYLQNQRMIWEELTGCNIELTQA